MGSLLDLVSQKFKGAKLSDLSVGVAKPANVLEAARKQYPYLKDAQMSYVEGRGDPHGRMLEYWGPKDDWWEWKDKIFERPEGLPIGSHGVEVFSDKVTPKDILGDYVSHHAVNADPKLKTMYDEFSASIPDEVMRERYQHATNTGESRTFEQWLPQSGVPEYFRGYTFDQWPGAPYKEMYTPEQIQMLDNVKKHIGLSG